MAMGQMWPEESKAIGLDPMKIQYQTSSTSPFSFFAISALHVVENSQYRTNAVGTNPDLFCIHAEVPANKKEGRDPSHS